MMGRDRLPLGIVLFGLGAGAALEIVAQEAVYGLTAVWAIIIAGGGVAALGLAIWTISRWPVEFQATMGLAVLFVGFLFWGAWVTGPFQVKSDQLVTGPLTSYERTRIRQASMLVLVFTIGLITWVLRARGSLAREH